MPHVADRLTNGTTTLNHTQRHHRLQFAYSKQHAACIPTAATFMMSLASSSGQHASSSSSTPLHVTIRFSHSHPDLDLDIPSPEATTVLGLKHLLRTSIA